MKISKRALHIAIALGVAFAVDAAADLAQLTQPVIYALTPIDSIPSTEQINSVHGNSEQLALANLEAIALSTSGVDLGVQLRAIRALTHYCKDPCSTHEAHLTLVEVATTPRYRDAVAGTDLLVLRAALEAIGVLRVQDDVTVLVPQLEHPNRDIRATAAHALRDLGNPDAIPTLRIRYQNEGTGQVKSAISDALRVLGQPST